MNWKILFFVFFINEIACVSRIKRHLIFNEGSRFFFSLGLRDNLFDYTTIFARSVGFKVAWNLPDRILRGSPNKRIRRRDLYHGVEQLLNQNKLNGSACIRKFRYETSRRLSKNDHFLAQLYEIIFSPISNNSNMTSEVLEEEWNRISLECPLSLFSTFFPLKK